MRTISRNIYTVSELQPKAFENAHQHYTQFLNESGDICDRLTEDFQQQLADAGLSTLKPQWSLSYSQGDGVAMYGTVDVEELRQHDTHFEVLMQRWEGCDLMYCDVSSNTVEAVSRALEFLEVLGYRGGDIHDDLQIALQQLQHSQSDAAMLEQARRHYGWSR
jgi:hypothetical protein